MGRDIEPLACAFRRTELQAREQILHPERSCTLLVENINVIHFYEENHVGHTGSVCFCIFRALHKRIILIKREKKIMLLVEKIKNTHTDRTLI